MTSVADNEKLTSALLQLEQVEKQLEEEKSTSAAKVCNTLFAIWVLVTSVRISPSLLP